MIGPILGPILARFWPDSGPILARFWPDSGPILARFWGWWPGAGSSRCCDASSECDAHVGAFFIAILKALVIKYFIGIFPF